MPPSRPMPSRSSCVISRLCTAKWIGWATEDVTIGGQLVHAGDRLLMNLPAGNPDTEFVDDPEVFNIDRNKRGHLGFGYGVHQCIGSRTSPGLKCRQRSLLWRDAYPGSVWQCPRNR